MKNQNPEIQNPNHSRARMIAGGAVVSLALLYGAITQSNQMQMDQRLDAQEQVADELLQQVDSLQQNSVEQQQTIDDEKAKSDYVLSLSGRDDAEVSEHLSYPSIEIPHEIDPGIAEKHNQATVHILSINGGETNPDSPLTFHCTGVKIDETTITSARHCFPEVYPNSDVPMKGGPGIPAQFTEFRTQERYFITSSPNLNLSETSTQAVEITNFGTDYVSGDSVLLGVDQSNEWFDSIEPLPRAISQPMKGDVVHVAGFPNGSQEPVGATGVVLGEVLSTETYGASYSTSLTVVGIPVDSKEDLKCNFGASGGSIATEQGTSYGDLAFLSRSFTPVESLDVTLKGDQLFSMESKLQTRLVGQDYILCAYSPILPVEMVPLVYDPTELSITGK